MILRGTSIHSLSFPPLVRMAILHYQFEAIHPFVDGNGRIGRLLITLMLDTEGLLPQPLLYLSAFFDRHRGDYYRLLLEVSQNGNWSEWIIFFLRGVAEQAEDAIVRANKLQKLSTEYREQLQTVRASTALVKIDRLSFQPSRDNGAAGTVDSETLAAVSATQHRQISAGRNFAGDNGKAERPSLYCGSNNGNSGRQKEASNCPSSLTAPSLHRSQRRNLDAVYCAKPDCWTFLPL